MTLPQPVSGPLPTSLEPPQADGTTLGTWTSGPDANGDFTAALDAHGLGLFIALDCGGAGTVRVALSDGSASLWTCSANKVDHLGTFYGIALGKVDVTVSTMGRVIWGLTIASAPLTGTDQG